MRKSISFYEGEEAYRVFIDEQICTFVSTYRTLERRIVLAHAALAKDPSRADARELAGEIEALNEDLRVLLSHSNPVSDFRLMEAIRDCVFSSLQ